MRRIVASVITLAAVSACRARPVSVVVPESQTEAVDISALSLTGDSSWRVSAAEDIREHAHGVQSAPIPTPHLPEGAAALAVAAPVMRKDAPARGFGAISPETVNADPSDDLLADDEGPGVLRTQVMLDRARFSGGVVNGKSGQNLEKALMFYQEENGLTSTGRLDRATYDKLVGQVGKVDGAVQYTLTEPDIAGPYYWVPTSVYEQAALPCECYSSALEMLDERFHTVTDVLRKLNPSASWNHLTVGQTLWVPNVEPFDSERLGKVTDIKPIVKIHVAKSGRYLHALAADGSIVYHFPTTVGSEYDPSPTGKYRIEGVQWHPVFHYDPTLYSDVPDSRPRATLPPGPNSPVGVVWIATSKDHVGIHGTPLPHTIGIASSHGCVRLANWDAARLAASIKPGVLVEFVN
ncbi:MAG TPA: L,D-transpeptidase family protein [Gemmatimonadaceae bacterium]